MSPNVNENILKYLYEESSIIVLLSDKKGNVLESNEFVSTLIGKKLVGLNLSDLFIYFVKPFDISEHLTDSSKKVLINITSAAQMPGTWYFHFYNLGESVLAIGEANILEIENLHQNLQEVNQELYSTSRELQKKNAELKKAIDLKNHFLGIASHDLRNPLGVIMGFSEILIDDLKANVSEDTIEMLESIMTSSEFMLKLLNDLLDVSALESGKMKLEIIKTDLINLIQKNIELNSVLSKKKNISIELSCTENIPEVMIDTLKIEQVLNNLISNALKFSQPGTKVTVSVFVKDNNVITGVTDEGQGIPKAETEKLFKDFEKTTVQSTGGEKSTGLGLSIVKKLIIAHKGQIWVESELGKGTSFFFSLPFII